LSSALARSRLYLQAGLTAARTAISYPARVSLAMFVAPHMKW